MSDAPTLTRNKILSGDETLALSKIYDIGGCLSSCHEPKGRANVSFLLTTTTGSYVLRKSSPRKNLTGIRFEVGLLAFLRERDYPAPEIIPTRQGEKFVEHDGALYLLSRFIPGEPYDPANPNHLLEAGRKFGLYHSLVKLFPGPLYHRLAPLISLLGPEGSRPFADIEKFGSRLLGRDEQKRLADIFTRVRRQSEYLHQHLKDIYPRLLMLVIQGSYGQTALIFNDDTLAGLVDFDRAGHEIRALDLACSLKDFCSVHGKFRKDRQVDLDLNCCAKFLKAYQEVELIPEDELQVLPHIARARHVSTIIYRCNSFLSKDAVVPRDERQMQALLRKLDRETAWLEWLEKHEKELVAALRGG